MEKILASVLIVNWNGKEFLEDCLSSVMGQSCKNFEVVLVDNASTDGSVDFVRRNFPKVKILQNKKNLGFSGGNNTGLKHAKGKYIATLNTDTKADRTWLEELIKTAESDRKIGMVSSRILFFDNKGVDTLGIKLTKFGFFSDITKKEELPKLFSICDGAGLWKKDMLDDINISNEYYDNDFFLYSEENDICFRARLRGWKAAHAKNAIVYHLHSGSTSKISGKNDYYGQRNSLWVIIKNMPSSLLIRNCLWILIGQAAAVCVHVLKGHPIMILRSKIDAIRKIPHMLKKRKLIQKSKLVSDDEISKLIDWRIV